MSDASVLHLWPRTKAIVDKIKTTEGLADRVALIAQHALDLEVELSQANEYARKLNLKILDLCKERDAAVVQLERANEEIEVHKDRIQDLRELVQEYRQCIRPGDLANLREEQS